jgi:hypothetical protein
MGLTSHVDNLPGAAVPLVGAKIFHIPIDEVVQYLMENGRRNEEDASCI